MSLSSLIEELSTKKENNKAGCTLTFGGHCMKCDKTSHTNLEMNIKHRLYVNTINRTKEQLNEVNFQFTS